MRERAPVASAATSPLATAGGGPGLFPSALGGPPSLRIVLLYPWDIGNMSWTDLNAALRALLPAFSVPSADSESSIGLHDSVVDLSRLARQLCLDGASPTPAERAALST